MLVSLKKINLTTLSTDTLKIQLTSCSKYNFTSFKTQQYKHMKFLKNSYFLGFTLFFTSFFNLAQELPIINSFTTENYGAENQNWAVSQAENNFIYVANNKGLLAYDGANWKLHPTPNETIMRSVKCWQHKIFTGFFRDFGFWKKNKYGNLDYTSIVKNQHIKMLEDEQIWSIIEIDGWMLFKSLQRIYLYHLDTKSVKIINAKNKINTLTNVDGVVYFQEDKTGLFKIENGKPVLVSKHPVFLNNLIVHIFKKEHQLFFITQKNGFYKLVNSVPEKWKTDSDAILEGKTLYSAIQLKNNDFALGTISNGFIYLDKNGVFKYQIDHNTGLSNNTVLSVFEDKKNNIWLGLDDGINCINNTAPFKMYHKKSDFLGTIYTSMLFKEKLYLGTNQGLFFKELNSKKPFRLVANTQGQVWNLKEIDGTLFCGHDSGTFLIHNNTAKIIFNNQGTWDLIKIDKNTILQGSYDGLYVLKKEAQKWRIKNKIKGFNNSSKFITMLDKNTLFVNHEYKGVFKIRLDTNLQEATAIQKVKSLQKGAHSSIVKYFDDILYASKQGVFKYDKKLDLFRRDTVFSKLVSKSSFISGKLIHNANSNKLWLFSNDCIKYMTPGKLSNTPKIHKISISETLPKAASGYENITQLYNDVYLLGTTNGYLKLDISQLTPHNDFKIYMNQIRSFKTDEPKQNLQLHKEITLAYENNNLEFFYSVPNFNKTITTKYQYKLAGFNKNWSAPTTSNSVVFENIDHGNYTLKVKALIGDAYSSNETVYQINIKKPWYLTNLFLAFYGFLALSALYTVHISSKRYYKKQKEDLLEKAKKETELKELESSQEIIKLNNEKLRNDIESKNRELASSTMNMIKRNEFLNTIKTELLEGGNKNIPKVIKIIDKNLNNSDDWKMFQEAFNNADKNFLKKAKEKHNNLTPNDLRLCAYLRLNLSSKEIAPLLNISPRSVEVKRYRLRKKMELPHDANLTSYILEL